MPLTAFAVGVAGVVLALGGSSPSVTQAATAVTAGPGQIVVQTMDSCENALSGAEYELLNSSGQKVETAGTQGASVPAGVPGGGTCPLQQGNCTTTIKGCIVFGEVPAGTYRIEEIAVPGPNSTNPEGYAPCNGGSSCQWEAADVTVSASGTIAAIVTNVLPNGDVAAFPTNSVYAGTPSNPVVFHDFGLAKPGTVTPAGATKPVSCDGKSNANDWITGTPSSECKFADPSGNLTLSTACPSPTKFNTAAEGAQPDWNGVDFPWQCMSDAAAIQSVQGIILSAPSAVTALSTFQVSVTGGYITNLTSAQDPGMSVVPNAGGFAVSLDPIISNNQTISGAVTIAGVGGGHLTITDASPSANSNFVENLYHDVLGRYGLPGEVGYWSGRMDQGMPGWQVAEAFSITPEYLGDMVKADYQEMLGVPADAGGLSYWTNYLENGGNNDAIMGSLGSSPTFYANAGGTDSGFITSLYIKVLHRGAPPSSSDLAYWTAYGPFATNQAARLKVANDTAFSMEQHEYVVEGWYETFLGRPADAGGLSFWTNQLDTGVLQQVGVASFTNTPEYFASPAKYLASAVSAS